MFQIVIIMMLLLSLMIATILYVFNFNNKVKLFLLSVTLISSTILVLITYLEYMYGINLVDTVIRMWEVYLNQLSMGSGYHSFNYTPDLSISVTSFEVTPSLVEGISTPPQPGWRWYEVTAVGVWVVVFIFCSGLAGSFDR